MPRLCYIITLPILPRASKIEYFLTYLRKFLRISGTLRSTHEDLLQDREMVLTLSAASARSRGELLVLRVFYRLSYPHLVFVAFIQCHPFQKLNLVHLVLFYIPLFVNLTSLTFEYFV